MSRVLQSFVAFCSLRFERATLKLWYCLVAGTHDPCQSLNSVCDVSYPPGSARGMDIIASAGSSDLSADSRWLLFSSLFTWCHA